METSAVKQILNCFSLLAHFVLPYSYAFIFDELIEGEVNFTSSDRSKYFLVGN